MGGGLNWHPTPPGQRLGVRLVNGSSHCSGTVEVWLELSWEPVCGALWDSLASEAVCLALGCGGAWETAQPTLPFLEKLPGPGVGNSSAAPNSTLALAPAVLCRSPDWKLCKVVEHACNSSGMPAKVTCAGTGGPPPAPCQHLGPQSLVGLWSLLVQHLLSNRTSISAPTSQVQVLQCPLALSLSSPNLLFRPRPPGY